MLCDGKREEYYSYCCTHISGRHLADCLYDTILQQYSTFFCRSPSSSTFSFFFFSFSVYFLYRLFYPVFASLPSLVAVSVLWARCYTPPRVAASLQICVFPRVFPFFLLSCFYVLLPFLSFFDFDLEVDLFHPVFLLWVLCCLLVFCCDSFSVSSYICV